MNKIILLICSFTLMVAFSANGQSQKFAFVEEFTQASCPPCEASTPILDEILHANEDKVIQLRYQTSWPGVDPMNEDNPTEVATRVSYYGVEGVPTLYLDGSVPNGPSLPDLIFQSHIDEATTDTAPLKIEVSHTISEDFTTSEVTVNVINEGTEAFFLENTKLRVAMVEEEISWNSPPGSTSITNFEYVMKKFVTSTSGMDVGSIAAGETWENSWTVDLPEQVYNYSELGVVAFIQNDDSRGIVNAGVSRAVTANAPDLSMSTNELVSSDVCDLSITPSTIVSNIGLQPIDGFTVDYLYNGEIIESIEITETLDAGESMTIDFESTELNGGGNQISYEVESNVFEATFGNNISATNNYLRVSGTGSSIVEVGFEGENIGLTPSVGGVDRPFENLNFIVVNSTFLGTDDPLGGFGESDNSLMINYWNWNPANIDPNGSILIADSWAIDSEVDSAFISFNHAFTSWGGSNDRLIVEVGIACEDTFTEVWNKAGADLRTASELNLNNEFFVASPTDWVSNKIDVSDFIGETIVARFRVVSAWGDMLYIDDINTSEVTVSSNNEVDFVSDLSIFPNPSDDLTNLTFSLEFAHNVNVSVLDFTGKVIMDREYGKLNGIQNIALNTSDLLDGVYLVNINFDGDIIQRKLHVIR